MIKYSLRCQDCLLEFDSWFSSSKEFDRLLKLGHLNCEVCQSLKIEKSLMSPNLAKTKKSLDQKKQKYKEIKDKLKEYQKFVKKNFEFVGDNFAYEARSLHYNSKKSKKAIYGNASKEDIKELNDEGIETDTIPWIEDKEN
tara:strand:- start:337 stop:759 length:423 start_codon:yes stop_codon:yes gene_type:complete